MAPLIQLRRDCTIPRVANINDKNPTKKPLTPKELLKHLQQSHTLNARVFLKSITAATNKIAQLKMIKNDSAEAVKLYKEVLQLAKEHNDKIGFVLFMK